ncbi:hypothetical protein NYR30_04140 [Gallibacterium salpingitidis]|uniref:hypothetical protein n=1 Tax=Gallibacterium salpingitidis TaxID=505341 RepID=UPI00266EBCC9|nr:hypothetical protein [Gallibacterium salpingitidis]WKT00484.1 hypothetical protein NYR30_04140 [Gallibacterium salpingitidis]
MTLVEAVIIIVLVIIICTALLATTLINVISSAYKNIIDLIASNCDATIECSKTIGNLIIRLHKKARGLPDNDPSGP